VVLCFLLLLYADICTLYIHIYLYTFVCIFMYINRLKAYKDILTVVWSRSRVKKVVKGGILELVVKLFTV